jgi:hypothetical protein
MGSTDPFGLDDDGDAGAAPPPPPPPPPQTGTVTQPNGTTVETTGRGGPAEQIAAATWAQLARVEATRIGGDAAYFTAGDVHREVFNAVATLPVGLLANAIDPTGAIRFLASISGHPVAPRVVPAIKDPHNVSAVSAGVGLTIAAVAIGGRAPAAEAGGGGATVELFHGTTQAGAESIMSDGLLPVSRNTAPFPGGSFFTHAGEAGQVGASHWAASRATGLPGGAPTVIRGTMPQALFDSLSGQGLIRTGPVPGLPYFPPQTVILPGGLPAASGGIQWSVVPLTF